MAILKDVMNPLPHVDTTWQQFVQDGIWWRIEGTRSPERKAFTARIFPSGSDHPIIITGGYENDEHLAEFLDGVGRAWSEATQRAYLNSTFFDEDTIARTIYGAAMDALEGVRED